MVIHMGNSIENTGERFIPESNDEELEIEHLQRYYSIQAFVKNKTVLDAACGEGYGSYLLSLYANKVTGIDIDEKTVQHARDKYGESEKLNYVCGSVADLCMIKDHSMDVVVSFETIEHVDESCQTAFLADIYRVLKEDGILIMSTPNKAEYTDRYNFHNKWHIREFYVEEFVKFLNKKFSKVRLYQQYLEVASFLDCEEFGEDKIQYCINREKYNPIGKYVIAVAGNKELPQESISSVVMHHKATYLPTLDELNYCRHEAIVCREKVKNLDACLNENKLQKEELDRRAEELEKRMALINELQEKVGVLENGGKLKSEELDRREKELENRLTLINNLQEKVNLLENEENLQSEELVRRARELEHRMDKINELHARKMEVESELEKTQGELQYIQGELQNMQGELQHIKSLKLGDMIKWMWNKSKN